MIVDLITPADIRYSYRGTGYLVYETARFLKLYGVDTMIIITDKGKSGNLLSDYRMLESCQP